MTGLRSAGGGGGGKEEEGEEVAGDAVCWQLVIVSFTLFVKARASNSCIKPGGMSFLYITSTWIHRLHSFYSILYHKK